MPSITCKRENGGEILLVASPGENLLSLFRKNGIAMDSPCAGAGLCGKCRIRVLSGHVDTVRTVSLSDADYAEGWRLACQSRVSSDAEILLPAAASAYASNMRITALASEREKSIFTTLREGLSQAGLAFTGIVRSLPLTLPAPSLSDTMPDNERLCRALAQALGVPAVRLDPAALGKLPDTLRDNAFSIRAVFDASGSTPRILDVLPQDTTRVLGVAIDIGTTSVAAILVDLDTGEILASASAGNAQIRYGADVISRIIEQGKPGGNQRLAEAIGRETLLPMLHALYEKAQAQPMHVYAACIAGNTTMEHLLLSVPANPLRMEPYIPAFFELDPVPAAQLALPMHPAAQLHLAANVGSYVGGDITAGVLATGLWHEEALTLFIDLGTNGEIVVGNNEFMMACACSAGPAFEGGDISAGMRATDGAIDAVTIDPDTLTPTLSVIGGGAPKGLCGSGIIECIAELFCGKIIDARGRFTRTGPRILSDAHGMRRYVLAFAEDAGVEVSITEVDIDNFIRAKGAVYSAIQTLLNALSLSSADLSRVLVAGGIGSGINFRAAVRIGMLPDIPLEQYCYVGNTSLTGAYAMLTSIDALHTLSELSHNITYLELSTEPGYMDAFVAACFLPHTNAALFPSLEGGAL